MTDIVQRLYAAIHLESAEIAPRTSALIEAAREAAYVIGKLQNALIQIRRITQEDTILDELKNSRPMTDIVEKLRDNTIPQGVLRPLCSDAADEIERRGAALRVIADWPAFVVRGDWERMTSYAREQIEKSAPADKEQR